jgi:hypothetical protein
MFVNLFNKAETCSFIIQERHFIFVSHAARFSVFWRGVGGRFALFVVFCHSQVLYIRELCNSYVGFVLRLKIMLDYNQLKIQSGTNFLPQLFYRKNNNVRVYSVVEHQINKCR